MAHAGLGNGWRCSFANDFDPMKAATYSANWGGNHLKVADINALTTSDLPGCADLAWASFPCQDLSLAGNAAGLGTEDAQTRSGAFWAFWRLMIALQGEGRAPAVIVLENVYGVLTANGGREFAMIGRCLALEGYAFGALLIDGALFVPQSRPRVFIVAVRQDVTVPPGLVSVAPLPRWHPPAMSAAIERLAEPDLERWRWWQLPVPKTRPPELASLIEEEPTGVQWHSPAQTACLIAMMSDVSLAKLAAMKAAASVRVGTIYKRTRPDGTGARVQRAELRDDNIAGCLRTPGGGSSRQTIVVVDGASVRTRLLSPREAARLMGLPDHYELPERYNDAYHIAGDGLIVPVVRYLSQHLIEPILAANAQPLLVAAE